jgi:AmmeMemoRadiSam system protein B
MLRQASVAGQFYPEDKQDLEKTVDGLLAGTGPVKVGGEIFGLLLPHAGFIYSGQVSAYGFKAVAGKKFDTVIIIGDSHYERFNGVSVWAEGEWQTPLGKISVDEELAKKIMLGSERFFRRDSAHLWEHSIEVQLPFLQRTIDNFKILPIIFGSEDEDWRTLASLIVDNLKGRKVLIIASADLSHYLAYDKAVQVDGSTLKRVLALEFEDLNICAIDSAKTMIEITRRLQGKAELLKYANSGDRVPAGRVGDKTKVVGYGAVAFYLPAEVPQSGTKEGR